MGIFIFWELWNVVMVCLLFVLVHLVLFKNYLVKWYFFWKHYVLQYGFERFEYCCSHIYPDFFGSLFIILVNSMVGLLNVVTICISKKFVLVPIYAYILFLCQLRATLAIRHIFVMLIQLLIWYLDQGTQNWL